MVVVAKNGVLSCGVGIGTTEDGLSEAGGGARADSMSAKGNAEKSKRGSDRGGDESGKGENIPTV